MDIGFIQTRFMHQSPGGGEFHTQNLAEELIARGHNVTVYSASVHSPRDTGDVQTETYSVPVDVNPIAETVLARKAVPDVRQDCDACILTDGSAWYAAKHLSIPTAMVFHFVWHGFNRRQGLGRTLRTTPQNFVYEQMEDAMVNDTDAIVSISPNVREDILQINPDCESKIHDIPNGVDTDFFAPPDEKYPNFTVHFQGQLIDVKNPALLIEASAIGDEEWDVVIGGSGPRREALERLAKSLGVEDRVEFVGFVDYAELPELYGGSDLYVLPSEYEGMPLTVLEAASCGAMPVVSERAATDFVTDDFGVVLDELDAKHLASVIDELAQDRDYVRECGQKAREKALKLDWRRIAGQYDELLSGLVADSQNEGDSR